ncbi:hypothetical protein AGABI1DRAFT_114795 [Agaricus bisporus var. burnettii JB137-S8]|uniref:DUF6533 domain-containing protein n=1 Tax=Agaricus bisporus var. burnettii (strain JB137-S8 / ATCC MYA-4627 / FGSC 10392) TaxID=597362 RepID=K5X3Z0_AGABU|nr:uncharacterized protein AGABI1DRAFT_114795 [Agaricus bisporus var. burnettii JB137-S8]EKM77898.1 hypothetical protein AGABI1DRAFT_114795 [Agaricus bisporus var. burnettii JB137-S8]
MSSVMIRQYTNIAGLVLLIYDQIITWDKEVNRVWLSSDWVLKIMFFFGRYWALAIQIINLVATHPNILEKQLVNCHKWFGFQTGAVVLLLINLQLILKLRVYALYERSKKMAGFLFCGFICYIAVMFWLGSKFILALKLDSNCMVMEKFDPTTTIAFCAISMIDLGILWGLTVNKYRDALRYGWSTNPILRLVMRDTSWSCLAIFCLFIALLPYTLIVRQVGHIIYCLLCSLVSILTCRTILNMRGLSHSDGPLSIDITTMELELTDLTPLE